MVSKTAIITGGGSGIGQALAWKLVEQNIKIIIIGRRKSILEETQKRFPKQITCICGDIADPKQRQNILKELLQLPSIDFVVHAAGILEPAQSIKNLTIEKLEYVMAVNCYAPLFLTLGLISQLRNKRVLQLSSAWAHEAAFGFASYSISKAALFMSTQLLNQELHSEKIYVGSVKPGLVATAMLQTVQNSKTDQYPYHAFISDLEDRQQLITPELCAKFLSYILLQSSNTAFIKDEWDIYDRSHHHFWVGNSRPPML